MRRFSDLACESLKQPGSWRCLEIVYRNEPRALLDRFFLGSRSARGARSRLQVMTNELRLGVEQFARSGNPVRLISLGSGAGHEILNCIKGLRSGVAVEAVCVDRDVTAIEHGRSLAARMGFDGQVRYVQGNVLRMPPEATGYHVAALSGLLDYFESEAAVSVLKGVRELLLPGGMVLVANMRRHRLASTMSILGNWRLVYRDLPEIETLLTHSGYESVDAWIEPEQVFCIGKGWKAE